MRMLRMRVRTLMVIVAVAALVVALARLGDGLSALLFVGAVVVGLSVAAGLSAAIDRIGNAIWRDPPPPE